MLSFPQFLLESSICLLVFYLFYFWVLRKETFFQLNRAYLLASPLIAILIPLLNIQLQQPSSSSNSSLDNFLYPAISNAHSLNQFFGQQIERPTPAFSLTIADLLFAIYIIGMLWMFIRLASGMIRLFRLIQNNQVHKSKGYSMVEMNTPFPASSFFSYVFWNDKNISDDKRLIFEHELVHIRQWHSIDVLLMELWVIVKWYNPLIYLYRNALQVTHEYIADNYVSKKAPSVYQYANLLVQQSQEQSCHQLLNTFSALVKQRLVMLGQHQSKWYRGFKYLLSIPLFGILMLLFSFNLVEEIPSNPLSSSLSHLENYLEDFGEHTILEIEKEKPYQHYMEWGGVEFPLVQKDAENNISVDIRILTPDAFRQIQGHSFLLRQLYEEQKIQSFHSLIETSSGNLIECKNDLQAFYQSLSTIKEEFSLFLTIKDLQNQDYYSIVSVSNNNNFYYKNTNAHSFFNDINRLIFSIPSTEKIIQANDLQLSGKNQYYLEWGKHKIQALKSGNPLEEPYDIPSFSLEEFKQLKEDNFSMIYNNSCLLIDSVYTMVSNGEGSQFRCKDQWNEATCHNLFLHSVDDNSTIYLVIKTKLGDLFSSIISIGNESTLYLENEAFFSKMLEYTNLPIGTKQLIYQDKSNYELLWGGLYIEFQKEGIDAPFLGEIKVSKKDFIDAIKHEPVLGFKNGSLFDKLSFEIEGKGLVESTTDNADTYANNKVIENLKESLEVGDRLVLKNIQYNDLFSDDIQARIHIIASPEPIVHKIAQKSNSYQFHWGNLDLKISASVDEKLYLATGKISIDDFKKSIEQEPVLTSRKEGVLFDFEFQLNWKKERFEVKSFSNNPDAYLESLDIEKIKKEVQIGDTIVLEKVSSENIEDKLRLEIFITEPSKENIKQARYKEKIVLDWGDYEFGIRQLNGDKRNAVTPPMLTLKSTFFKDIVCNEPLLYVKGRRLNIKEASVIIKETDYQENCQTDNWEERDCIIDLLENACEESQITLFFKTKEKENYILQFRLSEGLVEETISFGQDSTQVFNQYLKDYSSTVYKKKETKPKSNPWKVLNSKKAKLFLGNFGFDLQKDNHYSSFIFVDNAPKKEIEKEFTKNFRLELDGQKYPLHSVYVYNTLKEKDENQPKYYVLDCVEGECHFKFEDLEKILEIFHTSDVFAMNFMIEHESLKTPFRIANLSISTDGASSGWTPSIKPKKLKTDEPTFPFQMINRSNRNMIVRMDTTNQKYEWMVESYQNNPSVELIHIDDFQTHQRVIEQSDDIVHKENIKKVEVLCKAVLNPLVYPDFYGFGTKFIALNWRGFKASTQESDFYCLEDFKKANGDLLFTIDGKSVPILQFDAHFVDEEGKTEKYISNTIDKKEIQKAIRKSKDRTIVSFDEVIVEYEGKKTRIPMRFLFYLE